MEVQCLTLPPITALQRVYLHVCDGGVYQQWRFINVNWPWFSLEQRATGEVLDGAGNESNSMQEGNLCTCLLYFIFLMSKAYMLPYNEGDLQQFREFQQWRLVLTEG